MLEEDLPRVSHIVCAGYKLLAQQEGYTEEELSQLVIQRGSKKAIRSQYKMYRFLVATTADLVVGVVAVKSNKVTKLYVDPEFHRQGIGRALFDAAEEIIATDGHDELLLNTFPSDTAFYEGRGLRIDRTEIKHSGLLAGRQCVIMKKAL